ncbi:biotin-dependent carboxyltransferase family protein [Fructobacillus tropaeoli]|uniref:5-oxoprolinase subunit C/Allophanate hydrolase subunit 2 (PxpC) n=1 Tax=Fructobacillus tropaeoli TaxID=709323 RepID=A0ABM9ML65_9LACO|nr:biotin-dependent carboxyltransferase family protein [Fructobacillus tropaeoli]GIC69825.1 biotin-dependent carboxyltransferase family protein [Fructobacillus tropaeoli]CAK1223819.1 5-oxoprolinase subunit C/Allophanate hydrolase subunit 2 (PxpC) [Fructobacillus tropaeoli]CAK1236933.1 5-oxoprolinase subunit C/Allophanate hydrolase subunit 2 (PxpC) [Fructobacillus tropaeoli]
MNKMIMVDPGILATVQDKGRIGHQGEGFLNSGAMDAYAYEYGNALVGNHPSENKASVEFAITGGVVEFTAPTVVAITGARVEPTLNGETIMQDRPVYVQKGDILNFRHLLEGRFAYLAVAGGIQVPSILGSQSTSISVNLGGFHGRQLAKGDRICIADYQQIEQIDSRLTKTKIDIPSSFLQQDSLDVVPGPEQEWFDQKEWHKFVTTPYQLGQHINRMGYRIEGPELSFKSENLLSGANLNGGIQVSRDGKLIILLADRATHGGYPVIAKVIAADLGVLAQWPVKKALQFRQVSLETAWEQLWIQANAIDEIYHAHLWHLVTPSRMMAERIRMLYQQQ